MKKKIIISLCTLIVAFIGIKFNSSNSFNYSFKGIVATKENNRILVVKGLTKEQILDKNQKEIIDEISQNGDINTTAGWIKIDDKNLLRKIKVGNKIEAFSNNNALKDMLPFEMKSQKLVILK